jgi:RNA polymerase sigma-32 factor
MVDKILPSPDENEKPVADRPRKRTFIRVANRPAKGPDSARKAPVLEPEVLDAPEDSREEGLGGTDSDDDDIIDIGGGDSDFSIDGEILDADIEDDERRPALRQTEMFEEEEGDEDREIPEERGLVVSTGLQRYLAELRKYPLMTPQEERETAFKAYEQGDIEARNRLVTANLRLVVKIAMEYRRAYAQILDLIQEGNAGLVQAVNRFNPYRGVKLSTYSAWWIRAYILKFLMDNKSLVRMGTTDAQRKLFFRLRSEAEKMYALTQKFDAHLLAENIGVKESDVVEMQHRLTKNDVSLDAPLGEEGDARQVDTLVSTAEDPEHTYERLELLKLVREGARELERELNDRDRFIFSHRILADEPITLQDVGDKFGITRERARQLESRVLKRIKDKLIEKGIGK